MVVEWYRMGGLQWHEICRYPFRHRQTPSRQFREAQRKHRKAKTNYDYSRVFELAVYLHTR